MFLYFTFIIAILSKHHSLNFNVFSCKSGWGWELLALFYLWLFHQLYRTSGYFIDSESCENKTRDLKFHANCNRWVKKKQASLEVQQTATHSICGWCGSSLGIVHRCQKAMGISLTNSILKNWRVSGVLLRTASITTRWEVLTSDCTGTRKPTYSVPSIFLSRFTYKTKFN